ncbi:tripartite tricarboxylate transporter substrate binding protein [Azonexus sp. R2A61]|uniref:tripartite tricarboxylate transporter substrate binding protein n=1 Tax=Azonexus sp. R2A61 TaxID=2744443 RepID=UPI001F3F5FD0|nr:tripartite tricarboxylate transporter substrate binding protein [Azonexus sp. R2A61]
MSFFSIRSLLTASLLALAAPVFADGYPQRAVKLVVPFPPGGTADVLARLISERLSAALGQPVVIENKGGAGGVVGTLAVARATADGYTALLTTTAVAVSPSLNPAAGYDAEKDLTPVINVAASPNILLATPGLGAKTLPEAIAKARSGKLNYGTPGAGTTPHLSAEYLFGTLAGVTVTHVPYKGGGPALIAGIGGEVEFVSIPLPPAVPHVKAGKLVALAVTGATRSPVLPQVPTVAESGFPGFEDATWVGLFLPAGAPAEAVKRLNGEIEKILARPEVREQLAAIGYEPVGGSPARFGAYLKQEVAKWQRVVKATGIKAE